MTKILAIPGFELENTRQLISTIVLGFWESLYYFFYLKALHFFQGPEILVLYFKCSLLAASMKAFECSRIAASATSHLSSEKPQELGKA